MGWILCHTQAVELSSPGGLRKEAVSLPERLAQHPLCPQRSPCPELTDMLASFHCAHSNPAQLGAGVSIPILRGPPVTPAQEVRCSLLISTNPALAYTYPHTDT